VPGRWAAAAPGRRDTVVVSAAAAAPVRVHHLVEVALRVRGAR